MTDLIHSSPNFPSQNQPHSDYFESLKRLFLLGQLFKNRKRCTQTTLADKVVEPAKVESIVRLYSSPEDPLEEQVIHMFLHFFNCTPKGVLPLPHTNTFAMPGRPLFTQVKMSNGLVYLAAISDVGEISWFKTQNGKVSGFNPAEHSIQEIKELAESQSIIPTADLDRHYYKTILYPYHEDGQIRLNDYLDVGLRKDAPLNSKKPVELDGRIWFNFGGSFEKLNQSFDLHGDRIPKGVLYPPHLLKVFKKLEDLYETQKHTLGQMIYTLYSTKEMGTISPLGAEATRQIHFYNTEVINPNRKKKIMREPYLFPLSQKVHEK